MRKATFKNTVFLVLFCIVLGGCSRKEEAEQTTVHDQTATEQTVDAVREYGKRPIDRARAVQQLGEDRAKAMDEAIKSK